MEFDFSFQTLEFKKLFDSMQKLSSFYASYETILQFFCVIHLLAIQNKYN